MRYLFKLLTPLLIFIMVVVSLFLLEERKRFDVRTLVQIDPIPKTQELIEQKKYADAHEYLTYFMQHDYVKENPKAQELFKEIELKRSSYAYKTDKVLEGMVNGKSDEDIGRASAIASDFFLIGDIRDLFIEGNKYLNDEKVDKVIIALSSLGIIATASTVYTLGGTTPIKSTISFLKYGKRSNKLPTWLNQRLIADAKIAKETKSLIGIKKLFNPINKLYEKVGLNQTLNILQKSKNLKSLNNTLTFISRFGKQSPMLLKTTNQSAIHYAKIMPKVNQKNFLYASSYGENGLRGMKKLGVAKFIQRTKFTTHLSKTAYKGNLNSLFSWLQNKIPTGVLFGISILGLLYFSTKSFLLYRRIRV